MNILPKNFHTVFAGSDVWKLWLVNSQNFVCGITHVFHLKFHDFKQGTIKEENVKFSKEKTLKILTLRCVS